MNFKYDPGTNTGYVWISQGSFPDAVTKTVVVAPGVLCDYDDDDKLLGVEIMPHLTETAPVKSQAVQTAPRSFWQSVKRFFLGTPTPKTYTVQGHPNPTANELGQMEEDPVMLQILTAALNSDAGVIANVNDDGTTEIQIIHEDIR